MANHLRVGKDTCLGHDTTDYTTKLFLWLIEVAAEAGKLEVHPGSMYRDEKPHITDPGFWVYLPTLNDLDKYTERYNSVQYDRDILLLQDLLHVGFKDDRQKPLSDAATRALLSDIEQGWRDIGTKLECVRQINRKEGETT